MVILPGAARPPTFPCGEEAVHVHAAAGVGDGEGGAGHQAFLRWRALRGPHQAPARPLARALQQLHRLARLHRQLPRATCRKVLQDHRLLTSARQLQGRDRERQTLLHFYITVCEERWDMILGRKRRRQKGGKLTKMKIKGVRLGICNYLWNPRDLSQSSSPWCL